MDCLEGMKLLPDCNIDLTVTSPPYDNLRTYKGHSFDFEGVAKELFRITKQGGVVVWVVGDATIKGSETGTSFKQALYFMECGFNLHDTMIYKRHTPYPPNVRYWHSFEYMFVLSKGKPAKFFPLMQTKAQYKNTPSSDTYRTKDGETKKLDKNGYERLINANDKPDRIRDNIWDIDAGYMRSTTDKEAYNHPAIFPEILANDHIISWSNEGDIVLDPFMGSGTTAKMAKLNNRNYIGFEISEEYCNIAIKRIAQSKSPERG